MSKAIHIFICIFAVVVNFSTAFASTKLLSDDGDTLLVESIVSSTFGNSDNLSSISDYNIHNAKIKAAEFTGEYIDSRIKVVNGRISKQQVRVISSSYVRLISLDERKAVDDLGNFTLTSIATFELRKSDVMNQIKRLKNEDDLLDRIQSLQSKNDELMLIIDRLSSGVNLSDKDAFKEISRVVSDLESNDSKVRELFNHGSLLEAAEFGDNQTNRNFLDFNVNFVHKIMNGMVVELGMLSFTKNDDDTYDIQVPVKWHVKNNAGLTYLRDKIGLYIKPTMNYLPNAYSVLLDNGNGAKLSSDMRDFLKKKKFSLECLLVIITVF